MSDMIEQITGIENPILLKVTSEAAAPAGIAAGDWVIISKQPAAAPGDIVALMDDGDAVLREYAGGEPIVGKVGAVLRLL